MQKSAARSTEFRRTANPAQPSTNRPDTRCRFLHHPTPTTPAQCRSPHHIRRPSTAPPAPARPEPPPLPSRAQPTTQARSGALRVGQAQPASGFWPGAQTRLTVCAPGQVPDTPLVTDAESPRPTDPTNHQPNPAPSSATSPLPLCRGPAGGEVDLDFPPLTAPFAITDASAAGQPSSSVVTPKTLCGAAIWTGAVYMRAVSKATARLRSSASSRAARLGSGTSICTGLPARSAVKAS